MSTPRRIPTPRVALALAPAHAPIPAVDDAEHRSYVLCVLGRRCGWLEPGEREALLHDAYVILLEKHRAGTLDLAAMRSAQIRAWLTQTALNKALDLGKSAARRRSVPIEKDGAPLELAAVGPSIEEYVLAGDEQARVRRAIAALPDRQRTVIALRYLADRQPGEVRGILGLGERQYRRDIERGKRAIRERLSSDVPDLSGARAA